MSASRRRRLEWSKRAQRDLAHIEDFYLTVAGYEVADSAIDAIIAQAEKITSLGLVFRPGKDNTRECPLRRFPVTIVYRIEDNVVRVARA